ncbi:phosphatase 2C [Raphidocelis subcapitata]|uniref:Phosphatase 2C n=1 Tax=Raphidocelis subcapitata TaxID=307507 RepID=A0A2V0P3D0_9CHLO|nr:phosphatase 2C [Raphidocelis subcapitata]|eukprot:GBF92360.1 phosphatase 2C [Raphidocelis subcapitata]
MQQLHASCGRRGAAAAPLTAAPRRAPPPRRRRCRAASTPRPAAAVGAIDIGVASVVGPRPTQEDAYLVVEADPRLPPGTVLAAVFDGHGGSLSSAWLKKELYPFLVPAALPAAAAALHSPDDDCGGSPEGDDAAAWRAPPGVIEGTLAKGVRSPRGAAAAMAAAFREADAALIDHLKAERGLEEIGASGSTALVALISPAGAVFANLGDCDALLCRAGGEAAMVARRHRVYGLGPDVMEEMERVEAAGGWIAEGRVCSILAVARAFGDPEFKGDGLKTLLRGGAKNGLWTESYAEAHTFTADPVICEPSVTAVTFSQPRDELLILATDGLWDAVPAAEAAAAARASLASGAGAAGAAEAVAELAVRRFARDNVTVIVVDLQKGQPRPAAAAGSGGGWLGGLFGR